MNIQIPDTQEDIARRERSRLEKINPKAAFAVGKAEERAAQASTEAEAKEREQMAVIDQIVHSLDTRANLVHELEALENLRTEDFAPIQTQAAKDFISSYCHEGDLVGMNRFETLATSIASRQAVQPVLKGMIEERKKAIAGIERSILDSAKTNNIELKALLEFLKEECKEATQSRRYGHITQGRFAFWR